MRRVLMAAAALLAIGGPSRVHAQQVAAPSSAARDSFAPILDSMRATPAGRSLPSLDRFTWGDLSIPAGATVDGPVAAAHGNVNVRGLVHGDVFAVGGDVVVHTGGEVTGSALALQVMVIVDGGRVGGELKAATPFGIAAAETEPRLTGSAAVTHALKISAGWLVVVLLVGLGVIVFSGAQLEAVVQALENRFSTAFIVGVAAQVGAIPLLALLCLVLAVTIVGILLIPFAVVAYILGVAGLVTLGALAAASVAGHAIVRQGRNVRTRAVQSMVTGTVLLMLPWLASALLVNSQWGGMLARIVAVAITWVAVSAGLGAALIARGGMPFVHVHAGRATASPAGWQTPTPIGGIVAARRPTPTPPPTSTNGAGN
ncbi:MAG: polymer-forming cytoskeletal protein [Gemmatimonadaceae bacterium]